MRYGVCGGIEMARVAHACGYDYWESSVSAILKPTEPEAVFESVLEQMATLPLPCPALNGLMPAQMKLVGPQVDLRAIKEYLTTVFRRAQRAGIQLVVFGSGGARRIPDKWDHLEAWNQLMAFGQQLAVIAAEYDVVVAVEPLNRQETNMLNTVAEGAALVRAINRPAVRLLVDSYHWLLEGDRAEDIIANSSLLVHAHIATSPQRLLPGAEPCDLAPFFNALARANYDGRISFEGNVADPVMQLPPALALMRRLWQDAAR